jgi:hypothetical protein
MSLLSCSNDALAVEHHALVRYCGQVQTRCSDLLHQQAVELVALRRQAMRLRAELIVRETALAWEREDRAASERALSDLPARFLAPNPVSALVHAPESRAGTGTTTDDLIALEESLVAADLVICQTGCLSHNAYWRVQDHCRRTGKPCVLVSEPEAVRIVRIHGA